MGEHFQIPLTENNIKTPKEKLAAYDQLVEGLGGVDSFDEDTKKRLKAQSRIFRIKDLDENFKNQLRGQVLDKTDLTRQEFYDFIRDLK